MAIAKAGPEPLADLRAFLEPFADLVRRSESRAALERYTTGLLSDLGRKTAADLGRSLPGTNAQRLQEFLTRTSWDSRAMDARRIQHMLSHASVGNGVVIADDTGFAKKGDASVGVARQYSGTLGRVDNCQVVVTLHYVDPVFDWPVAGRLYLPERWANAPERRRQAGVPEAVGFLTKGQIALELLDEARKAGLAPRAFVGDAGYGDQPPLLNGLEAREQVYVVGVSCTTRFRRAEAVEADVAEPATPYSGRGRPRRPQTLKERIASEEAAALLNALAADAWERVAWREGTKGALVKQFARARVYRSGLRGEHVPTAGWLIGERPLPGHKGEAKYYFAWGLDELSLSDLVGVVHVRWVVERFYQDAKGELGLDQYEGRLWQGLHRHMALVMLAHSYLTLRQGYGALLVEPPPQPDEAEGAIPRRPPPARGFPPTPAPKLGRTAPRGAGSALRPGT
jgi:SRSO17 transposase